MISLIACLAANRVIGKDNRIPWCLPADMARFKRITTGHAVIMGRKTMESLGRPLTGRRNVVLTKSRLVLPEDFIVVRSLEEALAYGRGEEAFVIGGEMVYREFLPYAERLYITRIAEDFPGDTYFPEIDWNEWELISETPGMRDEMNPYPHSFLVFKRKKGAF